MKTKKRRFYTFKENGQCPVMLSNDGQILLFIQKVSDGFAVRAGIISDGVDNIKLVINWRAGNDETLLDYLFSVAEITLSFVDITDLPASARLSPSNHDGQFMQSLNFILNTIPNA